MTRQTTDPVAPSIRSASDSDVGQARSANEDSCELLSRADGTHLLVVADGMGGHRGGATASSTAVTTIATIVEESAPGNPGDTLRHAIEVANARIYEMAQNDRQLEGMGTTVVAFLLDAPQYASVAHVGDSRAYRLRQGRLETLTTDHSVVAEMHRRGLISADEAAVHPRRNEILRSVGAERDVEIEVADVDVAPGDRFVLCSDGLSGVVGDDDIAAVVRSEPPDGAVETLIRLANEAGGPDNITVQVLSIPAATTPLELSGSSGRVTDESRLEQPKMSRPGMALGAIALAIGAWLLWQQM